MDPCGELDPNFEPQTRARSNTWPLRPRHEALEAQSSPVSEDSNEAYKEKDPLGLNTKKSGSRRNAWGNLSYADLITKAIQSSADKRLTLSQIYDWMVQNVPYFKDKGDSTSSAGWKNSIRHNLSLHSRFMRIQNEGTGKSSWWVINPDARPGKTPRRRAGSMETKSYEKKRGRVKKKVEALRAALENGGSPSASNDEFLDPTFSLQFGNEFRPRASSNASSCGRLSPIQAAAEPDLHDNQVPPMSPIPWGSEDGPGSFYGGSQDGYTDQLVDSIVDSMKLGETTSLGITGSIVATNMQEQYMNEPNGDLDMSEFTSTPSFSQANAYDSQYQNLPAPPPYPDIQCNSPQPAQQSRQQPPQQQQQQAQQQGPVLTNLERVPMGRASYNNMGLNQNGINVYNRQDLYRDCLPGNQLSINTQVNSPARSPQPSPQAYGPRLSPCPSTTAHQNGTMSPAHPSMSPHHRQLSPGSGQLSPAQPSSPSNQAHARTLLQQQLQQHHSPTSILRMALTQGYGRNAQSPQIPAHLLDRFAAQMSPAQLQSLKPFCSVDNGMGGGSMARMDTANSGADESMEQQSSQDLYMNGDSSATSNSNSSIPSDIDMVNVMRGLDYDMDSVIKQELTLEGNLDFNFESVGGVAAAPNQNVVR